ncbi:tyrosine-type recombinase/integrase [Streptomyces albus]|uniref:tyrosine-type recombinase/integrase n=1 Tax=Streptomyces albus TaxID=1888 RepID=UPI0037B9F2EE
MFTYDVEFWSIRRRKGRPKPYELRWRVGTRAHSKSFKLYTQADGRRSELLAALRNREQFEETTGLPASEYEALSSPTWFEHATSYVLMKWPRAAAKHRVGIAEALAVATPVFVSSTRGAPDRKVMRHALYAWAFRAVVNAEGRLVPRAEAEDPPKEVAAALAWLSKNSLNLKEAAKPEHMRAALTALSLKLDGKPAADNTVTRKVMVLSNAMRFAIEKGVLTKHPMLGIDWQPPETNDEVDLRHVPGPKQARALIQAVREQGPRGEYLEAFFGCFYYAAMRPGEIASLKKADCHLPPEDEPEAFGELLLAENRPETATGWTDSGKPYDERGLKRRARGATRPVPIPPTLVKMLRAHMEKYGTAPDGRLFWAPRGGRIRTTEYCDLWAAARTEVLTPEEVASPFADDPYSLRRAGISLWIKAGVDPVEVARRAGHSLAVLYRFYARLLRGGEGQANRLIARALEAEE